MGQSVYKTGPAGSCPGVTFNQDHQAVCGVITHLESAGISQASIAALMGLGKGCCIKARAIRLSRGVIDGITYDFAGLSPEVKVRVVRGIRGER